MFNLCDISKVESEIFNITTYRKSQLQQALDSSVPEAQSLRRYISNKVESSANETVASAHNQIANWIVKSWHYNPLDNQVEIIKMIDARKAFALSGSMASTRKVIDEGTFGPDIKVEHMYQLLNQDDDLDRLQKNYKFLLTGIKKMAESVDRGSLEGMKIKTMYTNWIYMINNPSVNFIDPLTSTTTYRNQKEPNKLLGCYTKTSSDDMPADEKMTLVLDAYINSALRKVEVGQNINTFMLDVYFLFTECLKIPIFKKPGKYDTNAVNSEIEEMIDIFPDSKFTDEFIRKTNSIEEWYRYDPEDLENEFSIKPMEFSMPPLKLPSLEPLETKRYVEIEAEKDSLDLAYHLSLKLTGEEADIYRNVFQTRLKILKTREDTFSRAREIESGVIQLIPTSLHLTGLDNLHLGKQLTTDLIGYRDRNVDPTDKDTEEFIRELIREHINRLANSFLDNYRRRDWSMKVLNEENPELKIRQEIGQTLTIQDGIFYLLGRPLTLQPNINMTIDRKRGGNLCVITKEFILAYPSLFIVPKLEVRDGREGLAVKRVHDRGITGANYR